MHLIPRCGPTGTHRPDRAGDGARIAQAPARELPDDSQAGCRMRTAEPVALGGGRHQPHEQRQRGVQQRVLCKRPSSAHAGLPCWASFAFAQVWTDMGMEMSTLVVGQACDSKGYHGEAIREGVG
jgi:hypothetical protein